MRDQVFRDRVRAIVAMEAYTILKHVTGDEARSPIPDANTIAWAKAAIDDKSPPNESTHSNEAQVQVNSQRCSYTFTVTPSGFLEVE